MEGWARFALFLKFSIESEKAKAVHRFGKIAIGSWQGVEKRMKFGKQKNSFMGGIGVFGLIACGENMVIRMEVGDSFFERQTHSHVGT